jgi:hypothetical protein
VIDEQRIAARKPLKVKATVTADGLPPARGRTVDISGEGVSVTLEQPLPAGQPGSLMFELFMDGVATRINARVKVAYCIFSSGEFKIGFNFVNLELSSMTAIAKYMR